MEVYVWKPEFGLPSFNTECIQLLAFIKMAKVPVEVKIEKNPYNKFKKTYPVLKHGNAVITDLNEILTYFRERTYGADFGLSGKSCSDSYAFTNMLIHKLKPILEYVCWLDQKNYEELFFPWFIKNMPTPFNYIYPRQCRKYARELIECIYPGGSSLDVIQAYMNKAAIECFSTLATRLGQKDYFYGSSPTSLDACVYSYLAPLVKIPFPSKEIPNLLHTWPELIEYVRRIDARLFPELPAREQVFSQNEFFKRTAAEDDLAAAAITTKLLAFIFVAAAMVGYGISKNIINVDSIRNALPVSPR